MKVLDRKQNHRQLLTVILVIVNFIMMLPNISFADTLQAVAEIPSDVMGTGYEDIAQRLGTLGIMSGDSSGFRLNDPIKRAEFAAIVVRALGQEQAAKTGVSLNNFSDVASDYWGAGYIAVAYDMKIISGIGDGTFAPDANVTYGQAVKMVVSALGYQEEANVKGGFPTGYLVVADQLDVMEDITQPDVNAPATRAIVARLIDNALDVPLMIKTTYSKKVQYIQSGNGGTQEQTLLNTNLKLEVIDAYVNSVDRSLNQINVKKRKHHTSEEYKGSYNYNVLKGVSLDSIENTNVVLIINDKNVVINIKTTETNTVMYDYIDQVNGSKNDAPFFASLIKNITIKNANKIFDVKENNDKTSDLTLYVNDEVKSSESTSLIQRFAKIVLKDNKIVRIDIYTLNEGGIIESMSDDSIKFTQGSSKGLAVSSLKDTEYLTVVINGRPAKFSDLKADMVFDYWKSLNEKRILIIASNVNVTGKFSKYKLGDSSDYRSYIIGVDSKSYESKPTPYFSIYNGEKYTTDDRRESLIEQSILAYIDPMGQIRYIKATSSTEFYGIAMDYWVEDTDYLKIFREKDGKGEEVSYKVDLDGSEQTLNTVITNISNKNETALFKFALNTKGDVEKIYSVDFGTTYTLSANNIFVNETRPRVILNSTSIYFDGATIFAFTHEDGNTNGKLKPQILKWDSQMKNRRAESAITVKFDKNATNPKPKLVVLTSGVDTLRLEVDKYGLVKQIGKVSGETFEVVADYRKKSTTYKAKKEKLIVSDQMVSEDCFIVYNTDYLDPESQMKVRAIFDLSGDPNSWIISAGTTGFKGGSSVVSVKDGYIKLDNTDYLVTQPDDLMVYEVLSDSEDAFASRTMGDIKAGDKAWYVIYSNEIRVIFYQRLN